MTQLRLLSDQAITDGEVEKRDGLGFETYSKVLGDVALGTPGPFTIGIFGEWGTGKTSLMRLTQNYLASHKAVTTVWFNAWRYEKEEHPIVPLLATIIREIELSKAFPKARKSSRALIQALRAVAYGFSAKSKVKVPGLAEVEASFVAKEMIDRAATLTKDPLLGRSLYYEAFERLSSIKIGDKSKIVIFIDDLDRCFPDLAIKLLESIKLVLSQRGFIFILGVARTVIEGYLKYRYEKEYGLKEFQGQSYLDKIVQLPFHIPPHVERVHEFSDSIIEQLEPEDKDGFREILPTIASTAGGNPRATIRFVNNLLVDRAINSALSVSGEMETIQIEYFAVTRILQQRWPDIFSMFITSPELAKDVAKWNGNELGKHRESGSEDHAMLATRLSTDKDLAAMLFSSYGRAWLTEETFRTSSIGFLKRRRQEAEGYATGIEKTHDLFVIYNSEDRETVRELVDNLTQKGLSVWFDVYSLMPGQRWNEEIRSAMKNSKAVLICLGSAPDKRGYVQREIQEALDLLVEIPSGTVFVIPVLLPGVNMAAIPDRLRDFHWMDMQGGIDEKAINTIMRALVRK